MENVIKKEESGSEFLKGKGQLLMFNNTMHSFSHVVIVSHPEKHLLV